MRSLLLWLALASGAGVLVWACGEDVETATAATTTGAGGAGGTMATVSSTTTAGHGGTGGTGGNGTGGFADICEEACFKIEDTCGFTGACQLLPPGCGDQSQCAANCINDPMVDCIDIASVVNGGPLCTDCLAPCLADTPCFQCAICSCGQQFFACGNDQNCAGFLQCAQTCADGDGPCLAACQANNPSMATDELAMCINDGCPTCTQGGTGGGGGGAGGNSTTSGGGN
jgi:hypothetical protein